MKKLNNRILTFVLAAIMICAVLPMGAMAAEEEGSDSSGVPASIVFVDGGFFDSIKDKVSDLKNYTLDIAESITVGASKVTVSVNDFDKIHDLDGKLYELIGVHILPQGDDIGGSEYSNDDTKLIKLPNSVTIPAYDGTQEWIDKYYVVLLAYVPHDHALSDWITSDTNHWKMCLECKENYLLMDWHHDYDNDDICDFCEDEIVYYDLSIVEVEGAKITEVEGDKDMTAAYRDEIVVEVEAEEGYKVVGVRFYKIREDGSRGQLTRKVITKRETYGFAMPSFPAEIVAEVQKVG